MASSTGIRVRVHAPPPLLEHVTALVSLAGFRPRTGAEVALLVMNRDDPSVADQWIVDSLPHLVVRPSADSVTVGPFVHPGVTACLRCLAAAASPSNAVTASYADVDPALLTLGLGWALRDLATWQTGELPTTWSSTITIESDLEPMITRWPRHPHCGCSWGVLDGVG